MNKCDLISGGEGVDRQDPVRAVGQHPRRRPGGQLPLRQHAQLHIQVGHFKLHVYLNNYLWVMTLTYTVYVDHSSSGF